MILLLCKRDIVKNTFVAMLDNVTTTPSFPKALQLARTNEYDTALVDLDEFPRAVEVISQYIRVIGIGFNNHPDAIRNGAVGAINLNDPLVKIRLELNGLQRSDPGEFRAESQHHWKQIVLVGDVGMGKTQYDVLNWSAQGLTAKEISAKLNMSPGYVNQVLQKLYEKFEIGDGGGRKVKLAVAAMRAGVIT